MSRAERAKAYFLAGYNCAQSVVLAFREELGVEEETLARLSLPFGGGMGRLREVCGAVSGAAMCLGLLFPERDKAGVYALVQEVALRFREENGSYRCGELLSGASVPADRSPSPEARTPACAARILEEVCKEQGRL